MRGFNRAIKIGLFRNAGSTLPGNSGAAAPGFSGGFRSASKRPFLLRDFARDSLYHQRISVFHIRLRRFARPFFRHAARGFDHVLRLDFMESRRKRRAEYSRRR